MQSQFWDTEGLVEQNFKIKNFNGEYIKLMSVKNNLVGLNRHIKN